MADDISFMKEVEESLRIEKLEQFWKRFGNLMIAGCVGIVVLTSASVAWKNHQQELHTQQTAALMQADDYLSQNKLDDAIAILTTVENSSGGVAMLAKLKHADILLSQKAQDKALALYKEIAASGNDSALASLAAAQAAALESNMTQNKSEISTAQSAPFNGIAEELTALRLIKEGKQDDAKKILTHMMNDRTRASSERMRAQEMLDMLNEGGK